MTAERWARVQELFHDALERRVLEAVFPTDHPRVARAHVLLGQLLLGHGKTSEGRTLLGQALHVYEARGDSTRAAQVRRALEG